MDARERLGALLRERALVRGSFRLASGQISDHYFDCKKVTLDPEGAYWTAEAILERIEREGLVAQAIGGPTIGADPIAAAVAVRSHERGRPVPAFLVRGRAKDHGTGRTIENAPPAGTRVILVEDVITTGGSTLRAIGEVEEAGLRVEAVICLIDREQGGAQALSAYRFLPLFRRSELL